MGMKIYSVGINVLHMGCGYVKKDMRKYNK